MDRKYWPIVGITVLGLVLWGAGSTAPRVLIMGAVLTGLAIMWARGKSQSRKRQAQRRHDELIAAARNEPPPAPDLTGRSKPRGN